MLGSIVFWVLGFGLMFGTDIGGFIGAPDFFVKGDYGASYPSTAYFIFQTMFCATAATIVSGAMAERTNFLVYCIYSVLISAVIYPISGHWIWGGGWLAQMGFHDFAGSTAVHMVGGVASLVGAKMIGARIGKYNTDGTVNAIPGHSIPLGALGVSFSGSAGSVSTVLLPFVQPVMMFWFPWVLSSLPLTWLQQLPLPQL